MKYSKARAIALAFFYEGSLFRKMSSNSSKSLGFTLIELIVVVALVSILSALAIPAYQNYLIRARVSEALTVADMGKTAVAETIQNGSAVPPDNTTAGLGAPASYASTYVTSLTVTNGSIILSLPNTPALGSQNAFTITFTPSAYVPGQPLIWTCSTLPASSWIYVPQMCRN